MGVSSQIDPDYLSLSAQGHKSVYCDAGSFTAGSWNILRTLSLSGTITNHSHRMMHENPRLNLLSNVLPSHVASHSFSTTSSVSLRRVFSGMVRDGCREERSDDASRPGGRIDCELPIVREHLPEVFKGLTRPGPPKARRICDLVGRDRVAEELEHAGGSAPDSPARRRPD
jgi:hypothetical protein